MVRRSEHPVFQQRHPAGQKTRRRMDLGGLHRLLKAHLRQNRGQALGQHAFAGAGRPDQQHIVPARRSNLQGPLGILLPLHLAKIRHRRLGQLPVRHRSRRRQRVSSAQRLHQLPRGAHGVDLYPLHHTALRGVIIGDVYTGITLPRRLRDHRKHTVDGAQPPIQRDLPHKGAARQRQVHPAASRQNAQQYGQVIQRAALFGIGRGQVHHQHPRGEGIPQIADGAVHPLPAFLYSGIRQPHNIKPRQPAAAVHLHRHRVALYPA